MPRSAQDSNFRHVRPLFVPAWAATGNSQEKWAPSLRTGPDEPLGHLSAQSNCWGLPMRAFKPEHNSWVLLPQHTSSTPVTLFTYPLEGDQQFTLFTMLQCIWISSRTKSLGVLLVPFIFWFMCPQHPGQKACICPDKIGINKNHTLNLKKKKKVNLYLYIILRIRTSYFFGWKMAFPLWNDNSSWTLKNNNFISVK